jgi:Ca2+-binding RTX toxin-like protein
LAVSKIYNANWDVESLRGKAVTLVTEVTLGARTITVGNDWYYDCWAAFHVPHHKAQLSSALFRLSIKQLPRCEVVATSAREGAVMNRARIRTLAVVMSTPMALFAYNPVHALAADGHAHAMCDGHSVTMTVTSHSPHTVHGTRHRDVIAVKAAHHVIDAGAGSDIICGSSGHDVINGQGGDDTVLAEGGDDTVNGGSGDDHLNGGRGDDHLNGDAGDDDENGNGDNDHVDGDGGNDHLDGDNGDDHINGGGGDDSVEGGRGDDDDNGGAGSDDVNGGHGHDHDKGGNGEDDVDGGGDDGGHGGHGDHGGDS